MGGKDETIRSNDDVVVVVVVVVVVDDDDDDDGVDGCDDVDEHSRG